LVVVATAPFLGGVYCKSPAANCATAPPGETLDFDVQWVEVPLAATLAAGSGSAGRANATIQVEDANTATAHMKSTRCDDKRPVEAQQPPVKATWAFERVVAGEATSLDKGEFSCPAGLDRTLVVHTAPDLALVEGADIDAARAQLWGNTTVAAQNETATYRFTLNWVRGGGIQPPVPTPLSPTFDVQVALELKKWTAGVTPHVVEVQK